MSAFASGFQCPRDGGPMTGARSSIGIGSSSITWPSFLLFLLSVVDRLLVGLTLSAPSRLSVLPCTLRGGVRGDERGGLSVGRRTAGTYMGDLGPRNWRVASGKLGNTALLLGEEGDWFIGVATAEWTGEKGVRACKGPCILG